MTSDILKHIGMYLEKKVEGFKYLNKAKLRFTCPFCLPSDRVNNLSMFYIKSNYTVKCVVCGFNGNIFNVVRTLEKDKAEMSEVQITAYLKEFLDLDIVLTTPDIDEGFNLYSKYNFDLVPISSGGKRPYEMDWPNKVHKDPVEWRTWWDNKLNIGVKTGKRSNIIIVDIDCETIPKELQGIKTLTAKTGRGWHLFFEYDSDIVSSKITEHKIDVLSDGKQAVVFPSIIEDVQRKFTEFRDIITLPPAVKKFLLRKGEEAGPTTDKSEPVTPVDPIIDLTINPQDFKLKNNNLEGCCNDSFIKLGGILRKQLNLDQTSFTLSVLNKYMLEKPMPSQAINAMMRELGKYNAFDNKDLAHRIIDYLRIVEFANAKEIKESINESKTKIDKTLSDLVKEQFVIKKGRSFCLLKKAEWQEAFPPLNDEVPFKIPYFHDYAVISYGDLIILGGGTGHGKTHVALNMIKELVDQGVKPYYQCVEAGARMARNVTRLGMKEGDFFWSYVSDPTAIELEKNSVTFIDWLNIEDFTQTHKIFDAFRKQLAKTNGVLIVFMQLKNDGAWFAQNLINIFASVSARYKYDDASGKTGKWMVDKIREAKIPNVKYPIIPCEYNWDTKRLLIVEDKQETTELELV